MLCVAMNPIVHVRTVVLGITQAELALIARTSQGTVSKWEAGELEPGRDHLALIRDEVLRRSRVWDDRWFFDVPKFSDAGAAA